MSVRFGNVRVERCAYLEDCGGVNHAFDFWHGRRTFFCESCNLTPVRDVTFEYSDLGSESLQFMDEISNILIIEPAARGENDILHSLSD